MNTSVPKKTGTYADTLQAIGLADLHKELCGEVPLITDRGSEFEVSVGKWNPEMWTAPAPGYLYIWDSKKEPRPPTGLILDYRAEVQKRDAARDAAKTKAKVRRQIKANLDTQGLDVPEAPQPELGLATILASMRHGWMGDLQLYRWLIDDRQRTLNWTKRKLGVAHSDTGDPKWSNTQFLNPITGKGIHSPKTSARSANAINAALVDPFEDWLKLRGAFIAMIPYRNGDDFKLFVLEPAQAMPTALERIAKGLRGLNLWGGVRLDILAVLRCTEELIRHSDVMANGPVLLKSRKPRDVIAGLRQAYFKSLGTAAALMNDAVFPLPDWFAIETLEDGVKMLGIIEEFIGPREKPGGCLASLEEKNSDDCSILQQFREWLTSGELQDLLDFHASFATHLIQRRARGEWARPFSADNLSILLSERYNMKEIVANQGFQNIARAIRNSTIYSLGDSGPKRLDTRFGLAQKWKQKLRAGEAEFVAAVAEFVQQYNWDVINRFNRRYYIVQTKDLDELASLLDSGYGVETVGLLLLAYGYAQAPKTTTSTDAEGEN